MTEIPPSSPETKSWISEATTYYARLFAVALKNLATIVAILTAIGFVIVQSYLFNETSLMIVNIDVRQYLVAGAHPFINMARVFTSPSMQVAIISAILVILVPVFLTFSPYFRKAETSGKDLIGLINFLRETIYRARTPYRWLTTQIILFMLFSTAAWYGTTTYGRGPRDFGSGEPSTVILVFDELQDETLWPFPINPAQPRRSQPIEMLMQLTDGVLVRDPQNLVPVIVKADIIRAIIDASPQRQPLPTATAASTPAPTATP